MSSCVDERGQVVLELGRNLDPIGRVKACVVWLLWRRLSLPSKLLVLLLRFVASVPRPTTGIVFAAITVARAYPRTSSLVVRDATFSANDELEPAIRAGDCYGANRFLRFEPPATRVAVARWRLIICGPSILGLVVEVSIGSGVSGTMAFIALVLRAIPVVLVAPIARQGFTKAPLRANLLVSAQREASWPAQWQLVEQLAIAVPAGLAKGASQP